jgi:hypothetical protein
VGIGNSKFADANAARESADSKWRLETSRLPTRLGWQHQRRRNRTYYSRERIANSLSNIASGGAPLVPMVQSADFRNRHDATQFRRLHVS